MKVFLSYAQADEELARRIGDGLSQAGLTVWDYRLEVLPGKKDSCCAKEKA